MRHDLHVNFFLSDVTKISFYFEINGRGNVPIVKCLCNKIRKNIFKTKKKLMRAKIREINFILITKFFSCMNIFSLLEIIKILLILQY